MRRRQSDRRRIGSFLCKYYVWVASRHARTQRPPRLGPIESGFLPCGYVRSNRALHNSPADPCLPADIAHPPTNSSFFFFPLPCKGRRATGEERETMMSCKSFKVVRTLISKRRTRGKYRMQKRVFFLKIFNNFGM